jgi:hypothetical protein
MFMDATKQVVTRLALLLLIIISGCGRNDYNFLTVESLNEWLSQHKEQVDNLISIIQDKKLVGGFSSCRKGTSDNYSLRITNLLSEFERINPDECFTVIASREKQLPENRLVSVSFPVLYEGGCIPSGKCKVTSITFYPNEILGGFYDPIQNDEYVYTQLIFDGWYKFESQN